MWAKLALKLFSREFRRGELTVISAAIALAVLTVLTLSMVTERIAQSIAQKSSAFIAADRVLASNHAIDTAFITKAEQQNLQTAQMVYFDTMLFANDQMQFSSVKAASNSYPLKGQLKVKSGLNAQTEVAPGAPSPGNVWLSESVFYSLNINVGDQVELGAALFNVEKVIVEEPDAPFNVFSSSRRVLINIDDVAKTEVIQPGSRVFYRQLYAGDENDINSFYDWLKPQLKENQNWYGVKDRQSPISNSLNRAESFLLLAGLLGIILAAVAIAVSAKRYCERQYDPVAMMKTLGGSRDMIRKIYLMHLLMVCTMAVVVGLAIGYGLQEVATGYLAKSMGTELPMAGFKPWLVAISTGVICAVMFSIKPLLDLFDIPPLRVLRRNLGDRLAVSKIHLGLSALTVFLLMWLFSNNIKITLILFASTLALILVLFLISKLIFGGGRKLGLKPGNSWSLAIASIQKRANVNAVQLISFSLAIKLLLFLIVLKNDIISDWQSQLPSDAPNAFLVNITQNELDPVNEYLAQKGIQVSEFYPTIRGRVNAVNGEAVAREVSLQDNEKKDEEARSGIGRELNLTWLNEVPSQNDIIDGQWFGDDAVAEASLEESMMKRLDVKMGDTLTFLIGAQSFDAKITSVRKVNWATLKPNFFIILSPDVLSSFPATYISSVRIEPEQKRDFSQLLRAYPTITAIDVDNFVKQIQSTIEQVSLAIGFVLAIVVLCGALVLISQVQASLGERMQEIVILRTLGAKSRLIKNATLYEFLLLGGLAGLVAAFFSDIALLIVQQQMFDLAGKLHPNIWVIGPVAGGVFVAGLGYFMIARTLKQNTQGLVRALA
ncbi:MULTISPECIES: FtsX-like permease family protein [Pseudoalteromonas]|jgi:putative ABC transport system permease protein|uniref:FtsX-like permease family protein n=4 Tax=Gammaproteobacteria TaxID=1236 RepID=A0AB39ATF9_9GAMM|nr:MULTISPECIES: FtsX-like permease family protein [Pseudoalteromonas]MAY59673.1 cell division protein FtsX [Pseudoalteromonas sp.]KYL32149.1 cell division protein FtsX [Pseudoalteromonas spiralis]MDN3395764.1 FtsX-like permease family protein [Pseudoalteromonas sp. APC 3215]MDN3402583.1 FtsX-like permease family protein [Pseudoalteromonas sp. APC 3213]MDN3404772.1 FtsX-like permease family protein [Pseudoalteromonas sp. APC 3218]|tara:strand:+ start:30410 stop:32911 length:2502 start_codon:yes stop_codon:yes gene_type:complete